MEQNEEIAAKFFDEPAFRRIVGERLTKEVYDQIRAQEHPEKPSKAA